MEKNSKTAVWAAAGIFAVIALAAIVIFGIPAQREAAARDVVKDFGGELQRSHSSIRPLRAPWRRVIRRTWPPSFWQRGKRIPKAHRGD